MSGGGQVIENGDSTPRALDGTAYGAINFPGGQRLKTFVVTNTGLANLTLSGSIVGLAGSEGDATAFTIVSLSGTSVTPGGTASLVVRYVPSRVGVQSVIVRLSTNDPTAPAYDFVIRGSGRGVARAVISGGVGLATQIDSGDSTPSTSDGTEFGSVRIGATRGRTFRVTNTGAVALEFTGPVYVRIDGANGAPYYRVIVDLPPSVAPGASATFRIRFAPLPSGGGSVSGLGEQSATVSLLTNDPLRRVFTFSIHAIGIV